MRRRFAHASPDSLSRRLPSNTFKVWKKVRNNYGTSAEGADGAEQKTCESPKEIKNPL